MTHPTIAYLGLGSNLGDRAVNLSEAERRLRQAQSVEIFRASAVGEYEPVGGPPQGHYLNQVLEIKTELAPVDLLIECKLIEREMGRPAEGERWGPRVIDLDLLLYGNEAVQQEGLTVPHPLMHERLFVLEPLAELVPALVHPVLKKDIATLLAEVRRSHAGGPQRRRNDRVFN